MRRVGIDLALSGEHVAVVTEDGTPLGKPFRANMTCEGFERLLERATAGANGVVEFVMEPTGNVWQVLTALIKSHGHPVVLAKTQKSSDLRKFLNRHTKTDAVDGAALAQLPAVDPQGTHPFVEPSVAVFSLRRLVKQRHRFVEQATKHKLRLHALMGLANPHLMKALGEEKFGTGGRCLIGKMLNPLKVVERGRAAFDKRLRKASRGALSAERVEKLWDAYQETATLYRPLEQAGRLPFDYEAVEQEAGRELASLVFAEKQLEQIEATIEALWKQVDPTQALRQLPGLGPVLGATVEAFADPVERFPNERAFASYCGVVPRRRQSGNRDTRGLPMTKAGHPEIKRAMRLAADVARKNDPEFAEAYRQRDAQGWHHEKILGLLAHKLARRAFLVLNRRQRAAQSGVPAQAYRLRTPDGKELERRAARQFVREHYPSKRERASRARNGGAKGAPGPTVPGSPSKDDAAKAVPQPPPRAAARTRDTTARGGSQERIRKADPPWGACPNGRVNCTSDCCFPRMQEWSARQSLSALGMTFELNGSSNGEGRSLEMPLDKT